MWVRRVGLYPGVDLHRGPTPARSGGGCSRNATTMAGISTAGIHAPSVNFDDHDDERDRRRWRRRPTALIASDARHSGSRSRQVVDHHPGLAEREPGEHAERVQRDEGRDVALEDDDQDPGGHRRGR